MNLQQATTEIRKAIGYAKERGWKVINKRCVNHGPLVKGVRVCKVCPLMALALMHSSPAVQKSQLGKNDVSSDSLARRAGKILGVRPIYMNEFMGNFDNAGADPKGWPKNMSEDEIELASAFGDFGALLRKELKPRPS